MKNHSCIVQYACAVLLIVSSICLVSYQIFEIKDVADGLLIYVAQAFLLAGSIFGLDYYVKQINIKLGETIVNGNSKRHKKQQPPEY